MVFKIFEVGNGAIARGLSKLEAFNSYEDFLLADAERVIEHPINGS